MQPAAPFAFDRDKAGAQAFITRRQLWKPLEQSAQVETGSAHDHRQARAGGNCGDRVARGAGVLTRGVTLSRVEHVHQMVGDPAALGLGNLGGADVETPVELERITIDNLAQELFGHPQGERALSGTRGTDDGHEGRV